MIPPTAMQQKTAPNSPNGNGAPIDIAPIVQMTPNTSAISPPTIRPTAPAVESVTRRRNLDLSIHNDRTQGDPLQQVVPGASRRTGRVVGYSARFLRNIIGNDRAPCSARQLDCRQELNYGGSPSAPIHFPWARTRGNRRRPTSLAARTSHAALPVVRPPVVQG